MKRSFLHTACVLTTVVTAMCATTFGDGKVRFGSGGSNRGQGSISAGQTTSPFKGHTGNLNIGNGNGKSGSGGLGNGHSGGIPISGGSSRQPHGIKLPGHGNVGHNGNGHASKPGLPINISGHQAGTGKNNSKVTLPRNILQHAGKSGHTIQLANGSKSKPIAININQILKHQGPSVQAKPQIQNIVASAPKHLCAQPHFSWWVNVCHNHCHTNYGSWHVHNQYWDGWTACNWQIVPCDHFTYYVGLSCVYIPDMLAYGVQSVNVGSPAQFAGLQAGDLILTVNQQPVFDSNLMNTELNRGRLDLQVIREGIPTPLQLTVFPRLVQAVTF